MPQAKLVRDKIPQIMRANGTFPQVQILDDADFAKYALAKLVEESGEALGALLARREVLVEELADVAEVFDAICRALEVGPKELLAAREKKQRVKGGFEKRLLLRNPPPK
jgi:predicted house-cleaning noncanonical NTP pyrophosphatase (MazG superfamily)